MNSVGKLVGLYENHLHDQDGKAGSDFASVTKVDDRTVRWSDGDGAAWTLELTDRDDELIVGEDCPVRSDGYTTAKVAYDGDGNVALIFGPDNQPFTRKSRADLSRDLLEELKYRMAAAVGASPEVAGMLADARQALDRYMALAVDVREGFEAALRKDRSDVVAQVLERAEQLEQESRTSQVVDPAYNAGSFYHQAGDFENAARLLTKAVSLDPNHAHALNDLGFVRMQLAAQDGRVDPEAVGMLTRARELDPSISPSNLFVAQTYESARAIADSQPGTYGIALLQLNLIDKAQAIFEKMVAENPQDAEALNNLALCNAFSGFPGQALTNAIAALEINPRLTPTNLISAAVVVKLGLDYAAAN